MQTKMSKTALSTVLIWVMGLERDGLRDAAGRFAVVELNDDGSGIVEMDTAFSATYAAWRADRRAAVQLTADRFDCPELLADFDAEYGAAV